MEDDRYGLQPELRRPAPCFPAIPQVPSLVPPFFFPRSLNPAGTSLRQPPPSSGHFGPAIHHHIFPNTANGHCSSPSSLGAGFSTAGDGPPHRTATLSSGAAAVGDGGRQMEIGSGGSRWPRQETLTLLEIRCRLDSKFKGAIHKGPLWDEVSRIMLEEHGYNRSGKKCREKFENLYKYYKKTKDGKSGRQDGKNYRFFRQLEAIYGESSASSSGININRCSAMELANNQLPYDWQLDHQHNKHNQEDYCESISFSISNSSTRDQQLEASSNDSEKIKKLQHVGGGDDECGGGRNQRSKGWREKVKGFVDSEMRRLVERQDTWMDGMSKTIERREQERAWREVEWRRQETARFDREHEQWAKERAWIEARDAALMEALKKFARNNDEHPINASRLSISKNNNNNDDDRNDIDGAGESETWSLVQLRTGLEWSFQECGGYSSEGLWEAIAARMASLGYNLNGAECKEKWESIRASFSKI